MDEMMFYRNCIEALKKHKQNIGICLSKTYTDEWFKLMGNNKHCEWGQVCMTLKMAEDRYQALCDEAEKELEKV